MRRRQDAVLLLYHGLGEDTGAAADPRFTLPASQFREHLGIMREAQARNLIHTETLERWWSGTADASQSAPRSLILCFDDGLESDYTQALPALIEAGLRATFFINPARVGEPGYMDWTQVRALQTAGMSVQSHGFDHVVLTRLTPGQLETSLRKARHSLQQAAGTPVQFLAAPFGFWNRHVLDAALATGHCALCTSLPGVESRPGTVLARNGVRPTTSARQLQAWLLGGPGAFAGPLLRERLLWLPKQIRLHCSTGWPGPAPSPQSASSGSTF